MGRSFGATGVALATALCAVMLAIARRIACARMLERLDFAARLEGRMAGILLIGLIAGGAGYLAREMTPGGGIAGTVAAVAVFTCAFWLLSLKSGMHLDLSMAERLRGKS
jgi:hypothetical protein